MTEPPNDMNEAIGDLLGKLDGVCRMLRDIQEELLAIRNRHNGLGFTSWHERFGDESDNVAP